MKRFAFYFVFVCNFCTVFRICLIDFAMHFATSVSARSFLNFTLITTKGEGGGQGADLTRTFSYHEFSTTVKS